MPSSFGKTLALLALTCPNVYAEHSKRIFSFGAFSAIGGESSDFGGFAIINDNNEAIYDDGKPGNYASCYNTDGGRTFTIEGDCWSSPRVFHCLANFDGTPETCEVRVVNGNGLGSGTGQTAIDYIGISIGTDGSCVVECDSDDVDGGCSVDDGNGPLHVTSGQIRDLSYMRNIGSERAAVTWVASSPLRC